MFFSTTTPLSFAIAVIFEFLMCKVAPGKGSLEVSFFMVAIKVFCAWAKREDNSKKMVIDFFIA
jgi:hypothetical protein